MQSYFTMLVFNTNVPSNLDKRGLQSSKSHDNFLSTGIY